jgi:predicted O-linked N-acetylglucosamine transferase (SPINDLY family)
MSDELMHKLSQAWERLQTGDAAGALSLSQAVLQRDPRNPDALYLLGVSNLMTGRPHEAIPALKGVVALQPQHGAALENLGLAHLMLGELADAERALRTAAAIAGAPASVFMRLGVATLNQGRHSEAVVHLQRALQLDPYNADIYLNLGQALAGRGDNAAARREFEAALRMAPQHADAMYNLGVICQQEGDRPGASGWFERTISHAPRHVDALVNLGIVLEQDQRVDDALACFKRALAINPASAHARNNLAHALAVQGNLESALEEYRATLRADPNLVEALEGLASASFGLASLSGRSALLAEAKSAAERAMELAPSAAGAYGVLADLLVLRGARESAVALLETGYERSGAPNLLGAYALQLRYLCAWDKWRAAWEKVSPLLGASPDLGVPFTLICQPTSAAQQLEYTRHWVQAQFRNIASTAPQRTRRTGQRCRIGYLSSDFREHAISDLVAEVLELHDRSRFEIFAYSHGADDNSATRARLTQASEHFVDIADLSDDLAARRIRDDDLDVLVDLNGHTRGARTAILARRPCAVQVNWLGYPGTMGASFIDYLIADKFIIPPEQESNYAERVLRLPHCYLPNDRQREVGAPLARAEYGLRDDAFVFCSFNQVYKITPEVFACWMRLLERIPRSVLWLPADNPQATENLSCTATAHGIARERLVFAPRLPTLAAHLARYRVADLALDTFPYTSHTTASDALWAGCLLVGLCGETFAARVSGSVLTACNLPELVANSLADYEHLAYRLATDDAFRNALRARLAAARTTAPLFDSAAFARDLESLYTGLVA